MSSRHPEEDAFEDYVFHRLSEKRLGDFEEHLLVCEQCQEMLAETEEYIRLMKAATGAFAENLRTTPTPRRSDDSLRWNTAAAAILLLTCMTALFSWRNPSGDPKTVELQAYRGGNSSLQTIAPAGRALDLRLDLSDVRPSTGYRVEIVDAIGHRVWLGGTPVVLTNGLRPGDYWVRLATETGEPLREFGLRAE